MTEPPIIMETHGGIGHLYKACYSQFEQGIVFEKDARKADILALQRPTWMVYETDCVMAIREGAGKELKINFVDFDPYGEPWPVIDAFLESERPKPNRLFFVVNDGLRQMVKATGGWNVNSLQEIVSEYGNGLYDIYLEVCEELLKRKAAKAGYALSRFWGYYCGYAKQMTHYLAILEKSIDVAGSPASSENQPADRAANPF